MRTSKQWFMEEFVHETEPIAKTGSLAVASAHLIWLYVDEGAALSLFCGLPTLCALAMVWWAQDMADWSGWVGAATLSDLGPDA